MKLGTEFDFKHAVNGDGQETQNENRGRRHNCLAFITRVTIRLTSSKPPLLHQLRDVRSVELTSRSPYRRSTSGLCCLTGNRVQILYGATGDKCRVHISSPGGSCLDGEELRREINALYWRQMRDILKKAGIQWKGWHGFRRGLASNLNRLGVDDSVIQAILRHSNVAVTQRCYIKTTSQDAVLAMQRLSSRVAEIQSSAHLMDVDPDQVVQ